MAKHVGDNFEYTINTYNEEAKEVERVYQATIISNNTDENTYTISINGLGITKNVAKNDIDNKNEE